MYDIESLKEKYIRISSLFTTGLFLTYMHQLTISDRDQTELFNRIKKMENFADPNAYFSELFKFIDQHKKKSVFVRFMSETYNNLLDMAQKQINFLAKELDIILDQERNPAKKMNQRYEKLLQGYFCGKAELDEMLDFYSQIDEFEKCKKIAELKKKYYK